MDTIECKYCHAQLIRGSSISGGTFDCKQCNIEFAYPSDGLVSGWFWLPFGNVEWRVRVGYKDKSITLYEKGTTIIPCDNANTLSIEAIHNKIKTYLTFS